ncbi:MAG: spore coat protein U domain-containing protein [Deltaproteobacteria bacterium]|nr:MAG: spore coat protein U domain-containing protein [Deltaproteobacteria bacterium]
MTAGRRLAVALTVAAAIGQATLARAGSCSFDSVTGVSFGSYDVFNARATDSTGQVVYQCNGGAHNVTIDLSKGNAGSYSPRYMLNGSEQLNYNLYLDAARTQIWGDTTGGTSHYGPIDPPNATPVTVTIYGRVPAGADVSAGAYSDTITVTINY